MDEKRTMTTLARHVRRALDDCQREHNPWGNDLCGACGVGSHLLYRRAKRLRMKPRFCMIVTDIGSHCWVELDGYVYDVTATQFNTMLPKVLVEQRDLYFMRTFITQMLNDSDGSIMYDAVALADFQTNWPWCQGPSFNKIDVSELDAFVAVKKKQFRL